MWPLIKNLFQSPEYSFVDIYKYLRGMSFSLHEIAKNEKDDFWSLSPISNIMELNIPIYFVSGEYDGVAPVELVARYCKKINATHKRLVVIEDAGHFAFLRKSKEFTDIMVNIVLKETQRKVAQIGEDQCSF